MAVTQITTRDTQLEKQRYGLDLTMLENDGGTLKVSVGSVVEISGSIYVVDTAAETPTGTPSAGKYLYFTGSAFAWSSTAGSFDPEKGAIYNGANRRCRFILTAATTWEQLAMPEADDVRLPGNLGISGALSVTSGVTADVTGDLTGEVYGGHVFDHYVLSAGNRTRAQLITALDDAWLPPFGGTVPRDTAIACFGSIRNSNTGNTHMIHSLTITTAGALTFEWSVSGTTGGAPTAMNDSLANLTITTDAYWQLYIFY